MEILVIIAMIVVAFLMIAMGILFLIGSTNKDDKRRAFWFFIAMLGCAIWSLMNGVQWIAPSDQEILLSWNDYAICAGSLLAGIGLLGYCLPKGKLRIPSLIVAIAASTVLLIIPLLDFQLLIDVNLGKTNWFYAVYGGVILLMLLTTIVRSIAEANAHQTKQQKAGSTLFYCGLVVTAAIIVTFNVVFPFVLHDNSLLWVGSLSLYILMLAFYCNLFIRHKINLDAGWLRVASYIIVIASATIIYATIVFFTAQFIFEDKIPSVSVSLFAAIISVVLAIIIVAVSYLTTALRSLLFVNKIDISYMIDQIKRFPTKGGYKQMATFLANHLHICYCGLLIDGKLYGSHDIDISSEDLSEIMKIRDIRQGVWQKTNLSLSYKLLELDLAGVAELRTQSDVKIGQVLVGKPNNRLNLGRKDYLIFELIFNLLAEHIK